MSITAKVVQSSQELTALFSELKTTTNLYLPFGLCTSEAWLSNWFNHFFLAQDKLFVCYHLVGKKFIALYPLYLKKITIGYELRFMGTGEHENSEIASEFQDFVIDPNYLQQSLILFNQQIKQLESCYRISFELVLPDSICLRWLQTYKKVNWIRRQPCVGKHYIMPIVAQEKQQIERLCGATLRRYARRFTERTDFTVEYCTQEALIPSFFEQLIKLHNAHWQKRGKQGAFVSEQFRQFHLCLAKDLLAENQLLLYRIKQQDEIIAVFYGFYYGKTLYYYQSGISATSSLPNTGIALHLTSIRHARSKKAAYYDLMKGSLNSYKNDYISDGAEIYSPSYSHPLLWAWQLLKKMFHKILNPL